MYLIAIGWIYVALMMAVAEANNTNGTLMGAIVTFVLYGVFPVILVMYLLRTPTRNRARKARERAEWVAQQNAMAVATVEPATDNATADGTADASAASPADATAATPTPSASISQPDASGHAPGTAQKGSVTPVRKEL